MNVWKRWVQSFSFRTFSIITIILSTFLLFALTLGTVKEETYELEEFEIAPKTIRAPKTVEDTLRTEQERERVAEEVPPSYQFSEDVAKNRQAIITSFFDYVKEVQKTGKDGTFEATHIEKVQEKARAFDMPDEAFQLSDKQALVLLQAKPDALDRLAQQVHEVVGKELAQPVRKEQVNVVKRKVGHELSKSAFLHEELQPIAQLIGEASIVENETLNKELTESRIAKEKEAVEPVRILQGQVIVREGQVIDSEVYRQLELTGLLTEEKSYKRLLGLLLFYFLIGLVIYLQFARMDEPVADKKKAIVIVYTVLFLLATGMRLLALIDQEFDMQLAFLFPTALAPLLVRLLTNEKLALMTTVMTAIIAGLILQEGYASMIQVEITIYILLGGLFAIYYLGDNHRRASVLRTSLGVALVNIGFIFFYLLLNQSTYQSSELTFYVIAAAISGLLSGAMTIGLLPFFESAFGLLSDMKLIELSNPNHPLLKKVLTETPGTYHHSVMVANLSEAACEAIGAHGLLARVGSYYHDIGKSVRPNYFIENQHPGQNPHDLLSPERSRDIIIAHVTDGVALLKKHQMPKPIIDIAAEHHGTSFLKYFYYEAKKTKEEVSEDDFRYPGPKPQTKEAAVVSIADSVEAAVRSMPEPTPEKIENLVHSITQDKLNDGQFNECDITVRELTIVEETLCATLNGIFHSRIEYPTEEELQS